MIKYCTKCVTPDTRPKIEFNRNGICSACITQDKKKQIDWDRRKLELEVIFDKHRRTKTTSYDCLVPVSGGKDSIYQVHMVKNVYNMNPLCATFRTLARTPHGEENLQSLRNMGVDHIDFSPNPVGINKLTKKSFEQFGDTSLIDHLAIYHIIPNIALNYKIPLVIWGENPYMEYGGNKKDSSLPILNNKFCRNHHILKGKNTEDWVDEELKLEELQSLIYPDKMELDKLGYTPIFLGYYLQWDAKLNVEIAKKYGFKVRENGPIMGLYDYADLDCMNIVIHHYFKWLKFGFNRVTDHASNEIRKGRMTRDKAISLVKEKDGIKPPRLYIEHFCKQIGITFEYFWEVAERFRNVDIWKKNEHGDWYIEGWIGGEKIPDRFPYLSLTSNLQH